jgi:hypothetical protein
MKKKLFVVAGVLIVSWLSCGILSGQSTIALDPVYDNDVCIASASTDIENTVYQSGALGVGCRWDYSFTGQAFFCWESLVYFDVSTLAGTTINSAALELVVDSPGVGYYPRDWHIFALATPWNRATVTWANSLNQQHYTVSKIVLDPPVYSGQTYNVDVTSIVRAWVNGTWGNYGLRFGSEDYTFPYATSYDDFHFYSREDPGREWPKLFVTYQRPTCTYAINLASASYSFSGGNGSVTVTAPSGCAWTAKSNDTWITVTGGSSESGNGTVSYSVNKNMSTLKRTGTMTIAGKTFTVTQDGPQLCTFGLSSYSAQYGAPGGNGSVTVTAPSGCAWTAKSNDTWITVTGGSSGSGNGTVSYSVAANSASERSGTITIAGKTFKVTQAAPSSCTYSIKPDSIYYFNSDSGGAELHVEAPSGCAWTAKSNDTWITVTGGSSGSGNGTVSYSVAANSGSERSGTITIAGMTLTVNQRSSSPFILPTQGTIGTLLTITGSGFGTNGSVKVGGKSCTVLGWADGSITCVIKTSLSPPGPYDVVVKPKRPKGILPIIFTGAFTMMVPGIVSINPASGSPGDVIEVSGKYFSTKIGGASLGYEKNGRPKWKKCKVTEWFMDPVNGDSSIRFIVPKTTKNFPVGTYFLRVTNKTGGWESITFSVK